KITLQALTLYISYELHTLVYELRHAGGDDGLSLGKSARSGRNDRALSRLNPGRTAPGGRSRANAPDAGDREPGGHGVGWAVAGGDLAIRDRFRLLHVPFGSGGAGQPPAAGDRQGVDPAHAGGDAPGQRDSPGGSQGGGLLSTHRVYASRIGL